MSSQDLLSMALFEAGIDFENSPENTNKPKHVAQPLIVQLATPLRERSSSNLPTPKEKIVSYPNLLSTTLNGSSLLSENVDFAMSEKKIVVKPVPLVIQRSLFPNQTPPNAKTPVPVKTPDMLSAAINVSGIVPRGMVSEVKNGVRQVSRNFIIRQPPVHANQGSLNLPAPFAKGPSFVQSQNLLPVAYNRPDYSENETLPCPSERKDVLKPVFAPKAEAFLRQQSSSFPWSARFPPAAAMKSNHIVAVPGSNTTTIPKVIVQPHREMYNSTTMSSMASSNDNGPHYRNRNAPAFTGRPVSFPEIEEHIEEEEELGLAETYSNYMPSKLKLGERHPDSVVETSSLSSVPPPDVWYRLCIPENVIDKGSLSALQLEAITYACQQHDTILPDGNRAGFLIGDGAGVGKGRTLAGIIYENYLLGRKRSLWLSVSNDLKYDAERDFSDIGASKIQVHALNKFKYAKISSKVNGSVKKGVIFATYSSLIGESQTEKKYNTRMKQLLNWCGDDFDGCIVFDECHKAKNLCPVGSTKPTKTGLTVLELQNKLPNARIVYASATGASEPKNMAYMTRLGLWGTGTPFKEFSEFISVVEKRGVGAMELVAMDMKLRGLYMARQLSFAGVSFKIEEIPLSESFKKMYNQSVDLWVDAREKFAEAADLMEGDAKLKKTMWGQFWASHQRFFKYLCIASKVPHVIHLTREAAKNGKCVVIGLQSTGEAQTSEQLEEHGGELTDFVSTAKGVFQSLVERQFPAPDRTKTMKLFDKKLPNLINDTDQHKPSSVVTTSSSNKRKRTQDEPDAGCYKKSKFSGESSSELSSDDTDNSDSDADSTGSDSSLVSSSHEKVSNHSSDSEALSFIWVGFSDICESLQPEAIRRRKKKLRKKRKKAQSALLEEKVPERHPVILDYAEKAIRMKEELLQKLDELKDLPANTLDQLIDDLGGPECVAEMTGRKGRVVSSDGTIRYEVRSENDVPLEVLNLTEKQRFMDGEKNIAIISEAASSGISLHSDRRVKNQARRVHMTLELPWSADRAIQQFGRTHRSNQVNAPEYLFLISDLAGERRFASIVAKRLESLGALTHGDRRATESRDLSMFNFDTKYGRTALERTMQAVMEHNKPMVPSPMDYKGHFFRDVRNALCGVNIISLDPRSQIPFIEKSFNMSKFLNRILGVRVELQNTLFKYFTDTLDAIIQKEKKSGQYDLGILDLGAGGGQVKRKECNSFIRKHATGKAKTELHTVLVERGLSWEEAVEKYTELKNEDTCFYLSAQARNNRKTAILAVLDKQRSRVAKKQLFRIYKPNTGLQSKHETLAELSKYRKSTKADVEQYWTDNFNHSKDLCSHIFWYGSCRKKTMGLDCEVGLRQRKYHVLSGSVLSVWTKVENVISTVSSGTQNAKLQVVRLRTDDKNNTRIVGCLIPEIAILSLIAVLSEDSDEVSKEEFN